MTDKLPPIDPGNVRALVRVEGAGQTMFVDYAVSELPRWLCSLDEGAQALARKPLIHGTHEGSATARIIFDQSLTAETYPLELFPIRLHRLPTVNWRTERSRPKVPGST